MADCVFPAQAFQHPVPGAMEPRAVADALETGEEDAVTEALRSFNREVRGIRLPWKSQEERKQRCARSSAGVCVRVWQGARQWVVGWASGVSVVGCGGAGVWEARVGLALRSERWLLLQR